MRRYVYYFVIAALFALAGCHTAYHSGMTDDEKIIARYEQQVKGRWLKRPFIDFISLGFAEIWYQHATSSYDGVMEHLRRQAEAERRWQEWRQAQIGRTRSELQAELGIPDADEPDGDGGRVLTWENSSAVGGVSLHGNSWVGVTGVSWGSNTTIERLYAIVDSVGKVKAVNRREKRSAGRGR
jgi:hypothetical protein